MHNLMSKSLQRDSNGTKFPDINSHGTKGNSFREEGDGMSNMQPSISGGLEMQSPFRLPSDEEVFLFRENERQRRQDIKATSGDQNIWDKKTAGNRSQLKHYKKFETMKDDKFASKTAYNTKEKKIIQDALEIAKERQKNRENGTLKEPIVNLLEQKKEMFLVTMAHGIIHNEIQKLKQTSEDKQQALELSGKMLEQDHENFQKYLENNKQQKVDAENRADTEIKEKKAREQEIKTYNIKLTSLRTEKTRNEEVVGNYKEHKDFLDKLAPKEWNDQKEKKKKEKIQQAKEKWIQSQLQVQVQDESDNYDGKLGRRERDLQKSKKNPQDVRNEFEKQFNKLMELGEIEELDDFEDDFEMYFKVPQQLVELFNDLEERNLFLIQTTQEAEQQLEELRNSFHKSKSEGETKVKNLFGAKEMLKKNFDSMNMQIKMLQTTGSEKESRKDQNVLRKQIIDAYELFQNEINLHDYNGKDTLDILMAIELHLEKQLKQLRGLPPKQVEFFRMQCEREAKLKQREDHTDRLKIEQEERTKKNRDKILQPSKKRMGRQDMFRSAPFEQVEEKQEETINNEEEEDKKYFLE